MLYDISVNVKPNKSPISLGNSSCMRRYLVCRILSSVAFCMRLCVLLVLCVLRKTIDQTMNFDTLWANLSFYFKQSFEWGFLTNKFSLKLAIDFPFNIKKGLYNSSDTIIGLLLKYVMCIVNKLKQSWFLKKYYRFFKITSYYLLNFWKFYLLHCDQHDT